MSCILFSRASYELLIEQSPLAVSVLRNFESRPEFTDDFVLSWAEWYRNTEPAEIEKASIAPNRRKSQTETDQRGEREKGRQAEKRKQIEARGENEGRQRLSSFSTSFRVKHRRMNVLQGVEGREGCEGVPLLHVYTYMRDMINILFPIEFITSPFSSFTSFFPNGINNLGGEGRQNLFLHFLLNQEATQ